jgi:CubicO group peptidase (beta-lactamase class C family)
LCVFARHLKLTQEAAITSEPRKASHAASGHRRACWPIVAGLTLLLLLASGCTGINDPPGDGTRAAQERSSAAATTTPDPAKVTAATETYLSNIYSPAISNIRAVLVTVDGKPVVQRYRESTAETTHDVHSVTKSVMATLIGMAIAEGRLRSVDDTLATLLPQHTGNMSPEVAGITPRQLLTMTAGLPADPHSGDLDPSLSGPDWVASVLRRGTVARPGSTFAYASAGSHLLSAVLTHAVGTSVLDYARPRLFDPLGIDTRNAVQPRLDVDKDAEAQYDKADFAWPRDPTGIQIGFGTLKMAPPDLAKLGQLYLDSGRWNGGQVVPATWVKEATTAQVTTQGPGFTFSEGYGYQWWITTERGHEAYAAVGFGGQLVEVVPDQRLVVVTATEATDFNPRWEHLRGMVTDAVLPAIGG